MHESETEILLSVENGLFRKGCTNEPAFQPLCVLEGPHCRMRGALLCVFASFAPGQSTVAVILEASIVLLLTSNS